MMQKLLVVSVALALSACGNTISSSVGSDQSTTTGNDVAHKTSGKLSYGNSAKSSLSVPALGLNSDALLDPKFVGKRIDGIQIRDQQAKRVGKGDFKTVMIAYGPGGDETSEIRWQEPVAAVIAPCRAWQINVLDMSAYGEGRMATKKEFQFYLGYQEVASDYTNAIFTEITSKMDPEKAVYGDPEKAKVASQQIYKSIPKSSLKKLWADAVDRVAARGIDRTIDKSGSKGVDWSTADGDSYSCADGGMTWTKGGIAWFGKGALSGKQWNIGYEASIAKSDDVTDESAISVKGSNSEKQSVGATLK